MTETGRYLGMWYGGRVVTGLILVLSLLLGGCAGRPEEPPAALSISPGCLQAAPKPPADPQRVKVTRVVDGDTIELTDTTRVRLIGVNTPESVDPRRPVQAYGLEASAFARQLLAGKIVLLEPGQTPRDRYGRLLAWLWLQDGTFINALLVREGYAQVYTFSDNPEYAPLLLACQREASAANRGLWALPEYRPGQQPAPTGSSRPGTAITSPPGTVSRGGTATVAARTAPGAECYIVVQYRSGPSQARGLEPKRADSSGNLSWSWTVGSSTTPGSWPVTVTCGGGSAQTVVTVP